MSEWKECRLGDLITTNQKSIDNKYPHSNILYLDTGSIITNRISELQEFELKKAPSRAKRLVNDEDIIYSTVRPNQLHYGFIKEPKNNLVVSTGFVIITCNKNDLYPKFSLMVKIWDGEKCILNQHLFKVTSDKYPKWFYYLWCKYHLNEFIAYQKLKQQQWGI